ncbi:E3 SUMO-protein ligase ZBED1-like [Prorops nasuta]|uniref:E3 SUMO-protein ligase ZBED1-like n=1 Tax=Prorops nasuta TaxID=863751 RepID=UPI0034CF4283
MKLDWEELMGERPPLILPEEPELDWEERRILGPGCLLGEYTLYIREGRLIEQENWEEEIVWEISFQEDFDFFGIRWMQDGCWGSPNLQHEDPEDPDGWPPTLPPQKSVTWKYFVKVAGGAKCNMCHSTITTSGNTTNMLKHLQRKHHNLENVEPASKKLRTETCVEVDPAEDDPIMPTKQKSVSLQNKHLKQQPTILQSLSSMKSYEVGGQKSNEITNAIMFMIAKDNCPLNIVEREGFKKLMKVIAPMYQIPSRKNITKLIEEKYNLLSSIISDRLSQVECISLTTDIWTDTLNTKSFLGITAHYIDSEKLKSATLSVVELSDRHTSNNIGDWILEVLELWRIKIENIVAIVSDNASNMTKAIKCTFGEHRFLSCIAHSLNLVAVQIISDVKIKYIIDKVKTIVKYFKHSVVASDELRKKSELKFIQSVPTRWNSTFYMLQRFTEQSLIVGSVLLSLPDSPLMLSASEILTVKEFVIVLRPFEPTTIELCTERHTSIGKVIPIINCLRKNLIGLNLETDNAKQLRDLSITALEERFKNIENNTMLAVATILDPRFKCLHFKDNDIRYIYVCKSERKRTCRQRHHTSKIVAMGARRGILTCLSASTPSGCERKKKEYREFESI